MCYLNLNFDHDHQKCKYQSPRQRWISSPLSGTVCSVMGKWQNTLTQHKLRENEPQIMWQSEVLLLNSNDGTEDLIGWSSMLIPKRKKNSSGIKEDSQWERCGHSKTWQMHWYLRCHLFFYIKQILVSDDYFSKFYHINITCFKSL